MTANELDHAFDRWRSAMADALTSPDRVMAWQDRRYSFAYRLGQLLVSPPSAAGSPVTGHVVYGVYVPGGGLVYVGQTGEAQRRLRDLPVGESHHLATTVPPETWERVIVVEWPSMLPRLSAGEGRVAEQLGLSTCGLAIEYSLQLALRPVMTARRRRADGSWTERGIDASRSRGAVAFSQLPELCGQVLRHWDALATAELAEGDDLVSFSEVGRAVFPSRLLASRDS